MSNQFLTVTLRGVAYAIDATAVREIHYLPELTPIEELPPFIAGVYNLRGKILPVIDLHRLFGHPHEPYRLSDTIIVVETQDTRCGIICSEVHDVIPLTPEDIEPIRIPHHKLPAPHFIAGEAKVGENIAMILNHQAITAFDLQMEEESENPSIPPLPKEGEAESCFGPEERPEEWTIFHERAITLMQPGESEDLLGLLPTAVISLAGEFFGVELELVREFAGIQGLTPVPCCPRHIVGNMNLRGNILTLIDIREMLNLPIGGFTDTAKAVVAGLEEMLVGVMVDEVLDVIYLKASDITHVPAAVPALSEEYLRGNAPYAGRMMTLLNLSRILTADELIVREEA